MTGAAPPVNARPWLALALLCSGVLMISINATIVSIALASIKQDLQFSERSLVWVMNAYLATFGGFLLLGGRMGDLYGARRIFLLGIALFTLASLGCGLATSPGLLIASRAVQGLGGAIVSATALSQITNLFEQGAQRTRALGTYIFVNAGGGTVGLLLGGILTGTLSWQWIFLANVPVGLCVYFLCSRLLPTEHSRHSGARIDILGAMTITAALVLTSYAIVNGRLIGWTSAQELFLLAVAGLLLVFFVRVQTRSRSPLIPPDLLRERNLLIVSMIGLALAAAVPAWRYICALYLQLILNLAPMQVGLAFLPANLTIALMSLFVSPSIVTRFGTRGPFVVGMLISALGLALLAQAPVNGNVLLDVSPGMLLFGIGTSIAYNPLYVTALSSVASSRSGIASGIVNTSLALGGALGLSVLATIAAARTDDLLLSGAEMPFALNAGYQLALYSCAALATLAALVGGVLLRSASPSRQSTASSVQRPVIQTGNDARALDRN